MTRNYKISVRDGGLVIHCTEHTLRHVLAYITEDFGGRNIEIEEV